ncbi:hypothetical protein LLR47_10910 [Bacillus cereus]|uniref:hypothetical protein n=1 Tax=Bacillus cereus TaxID=1396 RepID=UPI001D132C91|nr:hypothetical protein [Bacillus cereus]MCC3685743.1 hypothetical protein [Bacillus cereus]
MAIVQDTYNIPDEISMKILTGEYIRIGSVVRHKTGGQIVKHLEPVNLNEDKTRGMGAQVLQFAKNNKTLIKVGLEIAIAIGTGIYNKAKKNQEHDVVVKFREALKVYLNAVREGTLTMEIITDLMARLGELKMHPDFEKIRIVLSTDELDVFVNRMFEYTKKLAADNAIKLTSLEKETPSQSENTIINLQRYLEAQKRIFELAS